MLLFFCFLKVVHLPSNPFLCPFVCYLVSTLIGSPSQVLHSCFCYDPWTITIFPLPSSLLPSPVVTFPDVQQKQSVCSCLQWSGEHFGGLTIFVDQALGENNHCSQCLGARERTTAPVQPQETACTVRLHMQTDAPALPRPLPHPCLPTPTLE